MHPSRRTPPGAAAAAPLAMPDPAAHQDPARRIQDPAWEEVPFLPLGECKQPTAYRTAITGIPDGTAMFWNVCPA